MKKPPLIVLLSLFSVCAHPHLAYAQDPNPREAVKQLCDNIQYHMFACRLQGEMTLMTLSTEQLSKTNACIKEAKDNTRPLFVKARDGTESKPPVQSAIKDLYAAFGTAIDATLPGAYDHQVIFARRVQTAAAQLKQACTRIDLDL